MSISFTADAVGNILNGQCSTLRKKNTSDGMEKRRMTNRDQPPYNEIAAFKCVGFDSKSSATLITQSMLIIPIPYTLSATI